MTEGKPLQAMFDVDDYDAEVVEGTGFEPGVRYTFMLEKPPQGKYMQYGQAKGGLFVLSKKCPDELKNSYTRHPDQFEIFTNGEVNGQQALVPGKDYDKFRPFLSKVFDIAWVHVHDDGSKRLIFQSVSAGDRIAVNPTHPEFESPIVRLSRRLGYLPPDPKSKEKFSMSFMHPGLTITAEVVKVEQKTRNGVKMVDKIDVETIELAGDTKIENAQKTIVNDIDPEIRLIVQEAAEGCKSAGDVIKKVKAHLKENKETDPAKLREYMDAITRMKDSKEILA